MRGGVDRSLCITCLLELGKAKYPRALAVPPTGWRMGVRLREVYTARGLL